MKATQFASFGIIPAALFIAACGDDVTKVTKIEETSGMEIIASADSLGKCTSEISGEMKFASKENAVYVCADSAWKNVSKAEKTACSAETLSDSSGYKIVCDGDSIGVVKNGANGKAGAKGEAGEGCEVSDNGDGTVSVVCGESSATLYKALCGNKPYDPDSSFCAADSIVPLCGGKSYDLDESFCFADSIVSLCGGESYNVDSSFCFSELVVPQSKKNVWDLMNPEIEYAMFVDDRDGQVYRSVEIGGKTWMAENLNFDHKGSTSTNDSASYCYNNVPDNCQKYGRLYKWFFAMSACPEGWHLPDTTEFQELIDAVGGADVAATALKSTSGWTDADGNDANGSDKYGFSALPAGMRGERNDFIEIGHYAQFLSSIKTDETPAQLYLLQFYGSNPANLSTEIYASFAASVRCVRD